MKLTFRLALAVTTLFLCHNMAFAQSVILNETFDEFTNKGGNDNDWAPKGYSTVPDNYNNFTLQNVYKANKCIKLGKTNEGGSIKTPSLKFEGNATLTFRAGAWNNRKEHSAIKVSISNGKLSKGIIQINKGKFMEYTVSITDVKESPTITIEAEKPKNNRFFLDDLKVETAAPDPHTPVADPILPDDFTFWLINNREHKPTFTIKAPHGTTVYYNINSRVTPTKDNAQKVVGEQTFILSETAKVQAVAYNRAGKASNVVARTYTLGPTVKTIGAFKELQDGTEACLYLRDEQNARVLFAKDGKAYVRDNSGAMRCHIPHASRTFMHNQHIAGWVIGKKEIKDGMAVFESTEHTNTIYLIIADKVTESDIKPKTITPTVYSDHYADWVTLKDVIVGEEGRGNADGSAIKVADCFHLSNKKYIPPYAGSIVDITGIALPTAEGGKQICPIFENNRNPVVYVIDEQRPFTIPKRRIEHAAVRVLRTLSPNYWNTLCLPFSTTIKGCKLREYDTVAGEIMKFKPSDAIEAGKPYLIKPEAELSVLYFENVDIEPVHEITVTHGSYSFAGTYSPLTLKTNKTERFLKPDGSLAYPQTEDKARIRGVRAYFKIPVNSVSAKVMTDTEGSGPTAIADVPEKDRLQEYKIYDLCGRYVGNSLQSLQKGIYIVNGKKMIIR